MNKRIRELHKQVMIWNDTPDCSYNAEFFVPEEYTQKFAELIIKECIARCRADEHSPSYEAAARIADLLDPPRDSDAY